MTDTITGGKLLCLPMDLNRGDPTRFTVLLDHMADHPLWFADKASKEEARVSAAWMLTDPSFWKYEVWNGDRFAGMFLLSRVIPKVDAIFHFTLLPFVSSGTTLPGAGRLTWNFLGYAFETFQFQRISAEIPEYEIILMRWFRHRFGFKFEGQDGVPDMLHKWKGATILDTTGASGWIASQGSRRERSHWDGTKWADLLLLRILRSEYDARASKGDSQR